MGGADGGRKCRSKGGGLPAESVGEKSSLLGDTTGE